MNVRHKPLASAIYSNNIDKIKDFLGHQKNINEFPIEKKLSALIYALNTRRSNEVVLYLIDIGSDVNARCISNKTPLMYALKQNYEKTVIRKLIAYGADVNHFCDSRKTPLYYAVQCYKNPEIVSMLIDAGAHVNVHDILGRSVFHAIDCNNCSDVNNCFSVQIIDLLIGSGVNLVESDKGGNTVLHRSECCYLIELAKKNGASINKKNNQQITPLMCAVLKSSYKKVRKLLLLNADPNCANSDLQNPLHLIKMPSSSKIFNLLAYHGTNVCARDVNNKTALDLLLSRNFCDLELKIAVLPFIKHYLLFLGDSLLNESLKILSDETAARSLINKCESEINKMKTTYIKNNLTFFEFCQLKKIYKSKFVEISINQYNYKYAEIVELFPIYHDVIIMRMKDNYMKNCEMVLLRSLEKINLKPLPVGEIESNKMGYDCFSYICCYLNRRELYYLFLASIEN